MLAGHETTSKSVRTSIKSSIHNFLTGSQMAYALWELAKSPESQTKLRAELDANVSAKGNADFTPAELENMPYLNAVIKVIFPGTYLMRRCELNGQHRKFYASTVPQRISSVKLRRTMCFLFPPRS